MNDMKFWIKLIGGSFAGALLTAFIVMNLVIKGGEVTMPNLEGKTAGTADSQVRQMGLVMKVDDRKFSNAQPNDCVLSQDIPAGSRIKRGRGVHVIVSKGPEKVSVPDLSGLSFRQALILLQQNGLVSGGLSRIYSDQPADLVLAQTPDPGATLTHDAAVSLLVSDGPEPVIFVMPPLAGRGLELGREALKQMGLVLRGVQLAEAAGAAPGTILAQSPESGVPIDKGGEVVLNVAKGEGTMENARFAALRYQVPSEGASERRVKITLTDAQGTRVVHNDMEKPGAKLTLNLKVFGAARYNVNLAGQVVFEGEVP